MDTTHPNYAATREEILDKLREVIVGLLDVSKDEIKADTDLKRDFGADDLDLYELSYDLEEEFEVSIDDAELPSLSSVSSVVDLILRRY